MDPIDKLVDRLLEDINLSELSPLQWADRLNGIVETVVRSLGMHTNERNPKDLLWAIQRARERLRRASNEYKGARVELSEPKRRGK